MDWLQMVSIMILVVLGFVYFALYLLRPRKRHDTCTSHMEKGKCIKVEHRNAEKKLHRIDGPAVEWMHGSMKGRKEWWLEGKCHREGGPAVECEHGSAQVQEWWERGRRHRISGPAIKYTNGVEAWWLNGRWQRTDHYNAAGQLHRDHNHPAVQNRDGYRAYWINGKRHREDGPAVIYANGRREYYKDDDWLKAEHHDAQGRLHKTNGPAVEWANGGKSWCMNGQLHRLDGPAVITPKRKEWWVEGKLHRQSGAAVEHNSGRRESWVDGKWQWTGYVNADGKYHRSGGPALEYQDGRTASLSIVKSLVHSG